MFPNLFSKYPIPSRIPIALKEKIEEFAKDNDKEAFLKKSFMFIVSRWGGSRLNFFPEFGRLEYRRLRRILRTKGYMHCTTMNFVLRVMAVKSGLFTDEDIKLIWTNTWYIIPHQYVTFKISEKKTMTLDPWNYQFGIAYGEFGSGFDSCRLFPVR